MDKEPIKGINGNITPIERGKEIKTDKEIGALSDLQGEINARMKVGQGSDDLPDLADEVTEEKARLEKLRNKDASDASLLGAKFSFLSKDVKEPIKKALESQISILKEREVKLEKDIEDKTRSGNSIGAEDDRQKLDKVEGEIKDFEDRLKKL